MYRDIIIDFFLGVFFSLRFDLFAKIIYTNERLQKLILKIIKYNIILHFAPYVVFCLLGWLFDISLMVILDIFAYPINIFSVFFHLLHYMDLMNMVNKYSSKTANNREGTMNQLSLTITISIYQLVIFLTTTIINLIFYDRIYLLAIILNLLILSIYHSFYCFNNLWQYKKIKMFHRIDMHEKLWPYYIGYGTIVAILYMYIGNPIILGIYNLYMILIISVPFLMDPIYPGKNISYPSINLTIFSYIIGYIFSFSKKIFQSDSGSK